MKYKGVEGMRRGNRVKFWVNTVKPEYGKVIRSEIRYGATYAEIEPDKRPNEHVFLFTGAVWGFEPLTKTPI